MIINSPYISGSLTVTGNIIASGSITLSGSVASASYAANADLLDGLDATVFTLTSSFNSQTASFTAFTSSLNSFSASILSYTSSQNILNGTYTLTSSFVAQTASFNAFSASVLATTASLNSFSSSVLTFTGSAATRLGALEAATASLYTATSSFSGRLGALEAATASLYTTTSSLNASVASLNSYTSSTDAKIASIYSTTSSLNTRVGTLEAYTASLNAKTSSFATTGSNAFIGTQTITGSVLQSGSFTSTGTLTAQTLVVQTITSSVDFVTGSTRFGSIAANTHVFTGSLLVTGSTHSIYGNVGIGTTSPYQAKLDVVGSGGVGNLANIAASNLNSDQLLIGSAERGASSYFGLASGSTFIIGVGNGISTAMGIGTYGVADLILATNNTARLTIASTGAATFSSSVDARGDVTIGARTADTDSTLMFANSVDTQVKIIAQDFATDGRLGFWLNQSGFGFVERMVIKRDTGNIGIGTTSPTAKLHSYNGSSGGTVSSNSNVVAIESSGSNGIQFLNPSSTNTNINFGDEGNSEIGFIQYQHATDAMRFRAGGTTIMSLISGNVGIGIASPVSKLTIAGPQNTTGDTLIFNVPESNQTAGTDNLRIYNVYQAPNYNITSDLGGVLQIGTRGGTPAFWSLNAKGGATFATSGGNVGIGTTSPAYKLDVNGDARFGDGNNFNPLIQYAGSGRAAGSPGYSFVGDLDTGMFNPNLGNTIAFSTAGTERIRIISDGNVGIGTTVPGYTLDVNGTLKSSGVIRTDQGYAYVNGIINITGGTTSWIKLGTISIAQGGHTAVIVLEGGSGYNADETQNGSARIFIRTSNGSPSGAGWYYSATLTQMGYNSNVVISCIITQTNSTTYDIYVEFGPYSGNTYYKIEGSAFTWAASNTNYGATAPTGGQTLTNIFRVISPATFASSVTGTSATFTGNVGIGTTSPANKVHIVGPALTQNNETTYGLWVASSPTSSKALVLGYDTTNDVAQINAVQQSIGWKNIAMQTNGGSLLIGTTSNPASTMVSIKGADSSNTNGAVYVNNSATTELFYVRNDGLFRTGTASASPYNYSTGTSANCVIDTDGALRRSTSSLKYKTDVRNYNKGLTEVLQMRPVFYKGKNDGETQFAGLIAEEVHDLGLTEFVQYAEDGTPDALSYQNMIALLTKAIQELKAEFDAYKTTHL